MERDGVQCVFYGLLVLAKGIMTNGGSLCSVSVSSAPFWCTWSPAESPRAMMLPTCQEVSGNQREGVSEHSGDKEITFPVDSSPDGIR